MHKQIRMQETKIERLQVRRCVMRWPPVRNMREQARLSSWKKSSMATEKECRTRNAAMREQKDTIARHYHGRIASSSCHNDECLLAELKARMKNMRANEARQLTLLSTTARAAQRSNEVGIAPSYPSPNLSRAHCAGPFRASRARIETGRAYPQAGDGTRTCTAIRALASVAG